MRKNTAVAIIPILLLGAALSSAVYAQAAPLSREQINTLVAPIALYPDPILSQVLVASTYPLQLVEACQWVQRHMDLQGAERTNEASRQGWDPSIQALVAFPDLLKRLTEDIQWTTRLGEIFLASQTDVMDGVQRMRIKAEEADKLDSTAQQKVITTYDSGRTIVQIQPSDPEIIYVPVYDPVWVWGRPVAYAYPAWGYPDVPFTGAAFWSGDCPHWQDWGRQTRWHDRRVIVNPVNTVWTPPAPAAPPQPHYTVTQVRDMFHQRAIQPSYAQPDNPAVGRFGRDTFNTTPVSAPSAPVEASRPAPVFSNGGSFAQSADNSMPASITAAPASPPSPAPSYSPPSPAPQSSGGGAMYNSLMARMKH